MEHTYTAKQILECAHCGDRIRIGEEFIIEDNQIKHLECASDQLKGQDEE